MGVAALVLGIVALVLSFLPCVSWLAYLPAFVGVVLGIVGLVLSRKTGEGKWTALPGLVFSITAIIWVPVLAFVFLGGIFSMGALASLPGLDELSGRFQRHAVQQRATGLRGRERRTEDWHGCCYGAAGEAGDRK